MHPVAIFDGPKFYPSKIIPIMAYLGLVNHNNFKDHGQLDLFRIDSVGLHYSYFSDSSTKVRQLIVHISPFITDFGHFSLKLP